MGGIARPRTIHHPLEAGRDLSHLTESERVEWCERRYEEDRLYIAWRRRAEPDYQHPWEVPDG